MPWLTKSRFMAGRQCAKRLWFEVHQPLPEPLPDSMPFTHGRDVDRVVQHLHPGIVIERSPGMPEAIARTSQVLARGAATVLYQPAFRHGDLAVIADVLRRRAHSRFELVEIKASTEVKPEHIPDAGFQALVLRRAGVPVEHVLLGHVNREFVLATAGDYAGLINEQDITRPVEAMLSEIARLADELRQVMAEQAAPPVPMGRHCSDPYDCPFIARCAGATGTAPAYGLDCLPRGGNLVERLRAEGFRELSEVPGDRLTTPLHRRVHAATVTGEAYFDAAAAQSLRRLPYPRAYLDFETIAFAVPQIIGTRPYQQLPFQWSLHVETRAGEAQHFEYLAIEEFGDFTAMAVALLAALPADGPVFAYNSSFERQALAWLAARIPEHAAALRACAERLVDLLPITRDAYYHRDMRGSWSIKAVIPTIDASLQYGELEEVRQGDGAQLAFLELRESGISAERRAALSQALRVYCRQDTWSLVVLRRFLCGESTRA